MAKRVAVALGRIVSVTVLLSSPTGVVLLILAATGHVSAGSVLAIWGLVAVVLAVIVRAHLSDLDELAAWIRSLAMGGEAGPPPGRENTALAETVASVGGLRRAWQQRSAELAESARRNESLLDNLPDPLLLLDATRKVVRANRAAAKLFGPELAGRDMASFLRDPMVLEATEAVLAGQDLTRECEFAQMVPLERVFLARVEQLEGHPSGGGTAVLTLHDLTTVKRMERMRADFVANASHELRTPLAALSGFIETLQGPARDDEEARDKFLGIMGEQAGRMSRLVADLLSLSRIELNEHTPPSEQVDLGRLVRNAAEALRPLAQAKGMEIKTAIAGDLGHVIAQPDELAQLFQNLMDNAVKYGRDNTAVEVCAAPADQLPKSAGPSLRGGRAIMVSVRDHGEGIAKEHIPRLTERFYRVDTARSRKMGGTGLGLAIVKHIVNRHRGLLTIDSEVGRGTTFTVWLPASPN
ncbi:two-component sensor histidine kinase [Paramagnetospirillum kuznetsovii]|uniref:histidine kinase n=1 Tax=Paramagnetospirillum kuznetsovii TaxID=2053833 RepID=A0A364P0I8_9PROT|nr:ATP-binding protein [Paramagnetospirillum kuznetsovii]RAU22858.1 two-component sensor histidine kinase [Paramagnetospirillum kuznetsovii]